MDSLLESSLLNLPQDLLRLLGIIVLAVAGLGLLWPWFGELIERPFARIPMRKLDRNGGAFTLGLGMGLVFVPCAGPVLAAITVLSATGEIDLRLVALTVSFAVGIAMAIAISFNAPGVLQRLVPGYVTAVQERVEESDAARDALGSLSGQQAWLALMTVRGIPTSSRTAEPRLSDPRGLLDLLVHQLPTDSADSAEVARDLQGRWTQRHRGPHALQVMARLRCALTAVPHNESTSPALHGYTHCGREMQPSSRSKSKLIQAFNSLRSPLAKKIHN